LAIYLLLQHPLPYRHTGYQPYWRVCKLLCCIVAQPRLTTRQTFGIIETIGGILKFFLVIFVSIWLYYLSPQGITSSIYSQSITLTRFIEKSGYPPDSKSRKPFCVPILVDRAHLYKPLVTVSKTTPSRIIINLRFRCPKHSGMYPQN